MKHTIIAEDTPGYITLLDDIQRQMDECYAILHGGAPDMDALVDTLMSIQFDARELASGVQFDYEV